MTFKELRQTLGCSREVLAVLLGVSAKTVERWEKGVTPSPLAQREISRLIADLKKNPKKEEVDDNNQ
jgi:DNA-binding transcriptional regulator YiaG